MSDILMKCGHSANAEQVMLDGSRIPCCVICSCAEIEENKPNLIGRKARCSYYGRKCHSEVDSKYNLAFFEHKPKSKYDEYYCGCYGWD